MAVTLVQHILAVVSGMLVGFTLGLIGGGGSILAVPLLLYLVGYRDTHVVIGTTALAVSVTAFANLIPHWRAGNVRWKAALTFALPGSLGAAIGAAIGKLVPGKQLLFLFALLMVVVAISMLRSRSATSARPERSGWSMLAWTIPVSLLVGILSGFFGIGGGFLIVPGLMLATGMPLLGAIGSSLVSVGTFGATTALSYALSGLVNWVIALEYIVGGVLGGLGGAYLATRLGGQKKTLTRIFAGIVLAVAAYILVVNLSILHL
ncbi:MAG: sulfite exporter TauE/SafE family protein [Ktedonobacteraceae bacterium]